MWLETPTYTKNGQKRSSTIYRIRIAGPDGEKFEFSGFAVDAAGKKASKELGRNIGRYITLTRTGATVELALAAYMERIPERVKAQLVRQGIITQGDAERTQGITEQLITFESALKAKGATPFQIKMVLVRVRRVVQGIRAQQLSDLTAERVGRFLSEIRETAQREPGMGEDGKVGKRERFSPRTENAYIRAVRQVCRWAEQTGRLQHNPIALLRPRTIRDKDVKYPRRPLSHEEMAWLLSHAEQLPERFGLTGEYRGLLYRFAVETAIRAGSMRALTRGNFDFDASTVEVPAKHQKSGRGIVKPLRLELVALLRPHLEKMAPLAKAFHLPERWDMAPMLQADLEDARVRWLAAAGTDAKERKRREESEFLKPLDSQGRVVNFHSLKHTAGSLLAQAGVHPRVLQEIMEHSDYRLTARYYTHVMLEDEASAVAKLPSFPTSQVQPAQATGTEGGVAEGQNSPNQTNPNHSESSIRRLPPGLPPNGAFPRISAGLGGRNSAGTRNAKTRMNIEHSQRSRGLHRTADGGDRTRNLRFTKPLLYH